MGLEIDEKRGDLWVLSAAPAGGAGTLHKLQLVSGRPLKSFAVPPALEPVTLVNISVTASGRVCVLDAAGAQLLVLRPGAAALERVAKFEAADAVSLSVDGDERVAYVAHGQGACGSTCGRARWRRSRRRSRSGSIASSGCGGARAA